MSSTLMVHNPKFDAKLVTMDALRALPQPMPLGPFHKPVPHAVLVEAIRGEINNRGYSIVREQLALSQAGRALFGVIDLRLVSIIEQADDRGLSFGFRNAIDQSMGIRGVAGSHVFVCDNLVLSGSTFALARKNTTHLDLSDAIARGFDKFITQAAALELSIERLSGQKMIDSRAKQMIYDVFAAGIMPVRLFDDVDRFYFHPAADMPDCEPRTAWGLHNAFTRAARDLSPVRKFNATVALGRAFDVAADVIDVDGTIE